MPPRNKRKRPVKAEPPDDSEDAYTSDEQVPLKRVKAEVKEEVKVEELSDGDFAIVLSDCELSDISDRQTGQPVRRSAGGRPPRRGVDVGRLYEEVGVGQLARSLGQVVKEEGAAAIGVSDVKVEMGSGSPLRVSNYVRRAAAVRAEQLLSCGEGGTDDVAEYDYDRVEIARLLPRKNGKFVSKFKAEQLEALRAQFDVDPYPDRATKEDLSEQFGVEYMCVQYWFDKERKRRGIANSNYNRGRKKCVFGSAVYDELVAVFERNARPDLATRKALAVKAGASVKQINNWFENRRASQLNRPKVVLITPSLRAELEEVFNTDPYPDRETRTMLKERIGCPMTQISNWFSDRRRKAGIKGSKEEKTRRACQFGPEGYDRLVAQFESDHYPDRETRAALAAELGGTVKQVSKWFQNRRNSAGIASKDSRARQLCALEPAAYDELVAAFEEDPFPDRRIRAALAAKTGGTLNQISNWFTGRRQREGIPSSSDSEARSKCRFGPQVYDELVAQFEADPFPDSATVKMLAHKYQLQGSRKYHNRFTNRRRRCGIQRSNEEWSRQACKFGPEVYDQLVAQFEADPYPSADVVAQLAAKAGATATQIRTWFCHRRAKHHWQKQH